MFRLVYNDNYSRYFFSIFVSNLFLAKIIVFFLQVAQKMQFFGFQAFIIYDIGVYECHFSNTFGYNFCEHNTWYKSEKIMKTT